MYTDQVGVPQLLQPGPRTVDHNIDLDENNHHLCRLKSGYCHNRAAPGIANPSANHFWPHSRHCGRLWNCYLLPQMELTNTIDTATPRVAPVEAVLISANVDESLSLVVAGLTGGAGTYCGTKTQSVTTTATSVPWGHLAAANTFYYAAQSLTVNTNATSGYAVTIQENDQMGKNGNICTGLLHAQEIILLAPELVSETLFVIHLPLFRICCERLDCSDGISQVLDTQLPVFAEQTHRFSIMRRRS